MSAILATLAAVLALVGSAYLLGATMLVGRFARRATAPLRAAPSITILKPLHGEEANLAVNLATFCTQDYAGPVQIVFGVQDAADPAIAAVRRLMAERPDLTADLVIDPAQHGSNRKVSNLINMMRVARHEVVVLADSDMRVEPDYLTRLMAALELPGVGAVTCLYQGLPVSRDLWPRLSALAIDTHFLPNVLVGMGLGLAKPCFGSTIALRRDTLARIGGFEAVADQLADDYALGAAVRKLGLSVVVPPFTVGHLCPETTFASLWRHELRWARTVRSVDPAGHAGSIVTHPLPFAMLAVAFHAGPLSWASLAAALACRVALAMRVERSFAWGQQAFWLAPLRDLLSFAVFVASFSGQSVTWKGRRYHVVPDGTLKDQSETPPP